MENNNNYGQKLSPFVYWAQTEHLITLKIDLRDVKNARVDLSENTLHFSANGLGARGLNEYKFVLNFFTKIDEYNSNYVIHDSRVNFIIKKKTNNWWPRLITTPQKPHWLKIDFDKWKSDEEDIDRDEPIRNIMQDYPNIYDNLYKQEYGYVKEKTKKVYLVFYNLAQFIGFLYIFCVISTLYYRDGINSIPFTYNNVGNALKFCQLLQYLEVMHPIFGYTKGGPLVPFLQVTGRNFILFIMIDSEHRMQSKPVIFYLFLIWTFIELFRYPYYITTILKMDIHLITYLRYTLWIPLYPLGILCEGIIMLRNIPYFEETKRYSIELPNKWNFTFDMATFLKFYILLLILPGTYLIMSHMSKLRIKKLSKNKININ